MTCEDDDDLIIVWTDTSSPSGNPWEWGLILVLLIALSIAARLWTH